MIRRLPTQEARPRKRGPRARARRVVQLGNIRIRRLLAHELGHGLRLIHRDSDDNLMQQGGLGRELTERQKRRMLRDCFVQEGCEDA